MPAVEQQSRPVTNITQIGGKPEPNGNGSHPAASLPMVDRTASPDEPEPWDPPVKFEGEDLPEFPVHALAHWLAAFVRAVAITTQTPVDIAGMMALAVIAVAMAKFVRIHAGPSWEEPVNIYVSSFAPPGERKSAVVNFISGPVREFESDQIHSQRQKISAAEEQRDVLKKSLEQAKRRASTPPKPEKPKRKPGDKSGGEPSLELEQQNTHPDTPLETVQKLRQQIDEFRVPSTPKILTDDHTPEGLIRIMARQGGRMGLLSPEGDLFDMISGVYNSNSTGPAAVYLKAHCGDDLGIDRVHRDAESVRNPALTIGVTPQPEVLYGLASRPGFRGRGLLGRFLYSIPTSKLGDRNNLAPAISEPIQRQYETNLRALLELGLPAGCEPGFKHKRLYLSEDANHRFIEYRDRIETKLKPLGELGHMTDWGGKLCGAVARIAALLTMAERVGHPEPWADPVTLSTIESAITIGNYLERHAQAAYKMMGAAPAASGAQVILQWIRSELAKPREPSNEFKSFSQRDAYRALQRHFHRTAELNGPLALLQERGYIRKLCQPKPAADERDKGAGGRPNSPVFEVNPDGFTK